VMVLFRQLLDYVASFILLVGVKEHNCIVGEVNELVEWASLRWPHCLACTRTSVDIAWAAYNERSPSVVCRSTHFRRTAIADHSALPYISATAIARLSVKVSCLVGLPVWIITLDEHQLVKWQEVVQSRNGIQPIVSVCPLRMQYL
jgi:hypothetical protein